jgi:16S rRNA (guanine527-N7)-methyltransferase
VTEAEARSWIEARFGVSRETMAKLDRLETAVRTENRRQNLVSEASLPFLWSRHIADSAQLVRFAPDAASWIDLGSGAGFPGLVVAVLHRGPVTLIEERRLRAEFLKRAASEMGVEVEVIHAKAERLPPQSFDVISARAFAPLSRLLAIGARFSTTKTVWIAPRGRNAKSELDALGASWQGDFRLEPSLTEPSAAILVARRVKQAKEK